MTNIEEDPERVLQIGFPVCSQGQAGNIIPGAFGPGPWFVSLGRHIVSPLPHVLFCC